MEEGLAGGDDVIEESGVYAVMEEDEASPGGAGGGDFVDNVGRGEG